MQLAVAITFILLAITVNFIVIRLGNSRQRKIFQAFTDKNALTFETNTFIFRQYPYITGTYQGYNLRIEEESKGLTQEDKTRYTVAILSNIDLDFDFSISKENIYRKIGKLFNGEPFQLGIKSLDDKLYFKSTNNAQLKSCIDTEIQTALEKAAFYGSIECSNNHFKCIQFKSIKTQSKMQDLEDLIQICVLFANKLTKPSL